MYMINYNLLNIIIIYASINFVGMRRLGSFLNGILTCIVSENKINYCMENGLKVI
jgi:hypothetical protein